MPQLLTGAVIFDLDGVLADTETLQLRAMNAVLQPFGYSLTQEEYAKGYVGIPLEQDLRTIHSLFQLPISLQDLKTRRRSVYVDLLKNGSGLEPLAGLHPFLDELEARHIPFGIASGSPLVDIRDVLQALKLDSRFKSIAAAEQVARPKPAPDVYLLAAERIQVRPASCLAIEDSASGIAAAKAAGMRVVAIPSEFTRHQDLSAADTVVEDLLALRRWLFDGAE